MRVLGWIVIGLFAAQLAQAGYAQRIVEVAKNYRANLDGDRFYGERYSDATTANGRLACARVVQIVLKKARVPGFRRALYGVRQIEAKTRSWKKITNVREIKAGDVVFWRKAGQDERCSGGGDCHVGVAVSGTQSLDNDGLWGAPSISRIRWRLRWRFMYARRPAN